MVRTVTLVACFVLGITAVGRIPAQLPGLPVLQNGFANPGITVGANYGTGDNLRGYAAAGAWAPSNGRFQLSAGIGGYDPEEDPDDESAYLAYGGRIAVPLTAVTGTGRFGIAPFIGIGGASREGIDVMQVPLGVGAGYRFAVGGTRAISVYLSPFYAWHRVSVDEVSDTEALFRASVGVDAAITPALGLSLGYELGAEADDGEPGPTSPQFGIGISYAFRR